MILKIIFYQTNYERSTGIWQTDTLKRNVDSLYFATTVCIESNYPKLYRTFNEEKRVQLFSIITNDGWFYPHYKWFKDIADNWGFSPYLKGKGPIQHQRIAQVRAIETRTSIVRAANTGISSLIDPFGNILDILDQYEEGYIVAFAPILNTKFPSFYQENGDLFLLLCVVSMLFLIALRKFKSVQFLSLN